MQKKAVFLDRDGTLIKETHFLKDPRTVELENTVIPALHLLQAKRFMLFIVTNQSGIARQLLSVYDFLAVQSRLLHVLNTQGIQITDFWFCPHYVRPTHPSNRFNRSCLCRKPKPGMLMEAMATYSLNPQNCWMIGDKEIDALAGQQAKIKSLLVHTGYKEKAANSPVFSNLLAAATYITNQ